MTARNAAQIATLIGILLDVENGDTDGIICAPHLQVKVKVDTSKPLAPGFLFPRSGRSPIWVQFLYERLADYCVLYGLVDHRQNFCPAPPPQGPEDKYGICLRSFFFFFFFSGPRSFSAPPLAIQVPPMCPVVFASLVLSSNIDSVGHRPLQSQLLLQGSVVEALGSRPSALPLRTSHMPSLNPYLPTLGPGRATSVFGLDPSPLVPDRGKGLSSEVDFSGLDPRFYPPSWAFPLNPSFPPSSHTRFMGPFPSYPFCPSTVPASPTVSFSPKPFHIITDPPPPAQSFTPPVYTPVPRPKHKPSGSMPSLARPHLCPLTDLVRGLVPSSGPSASCAPAISGQKRVFVDEFVQLSPSRALVSCGQDRDLRSTAAVLPSPPLKRRFSPLASPRLSL
jgi:hypothetical protein